MISDNSIIGVCILKQVLKKGSGLYVYFCRYRYSSKLRGINNIIKN